MKKILALLLLSTSLAHAQSVRQSGPITPGHPVQWLTTGVIGDGGPPSNGSLSGLGWTYNGTGACQNSAPITGAYNQLCLGTTTTGGGYLSFFNRAGATGSLFFNVNGTIYPFPFSGTGTVTSITAGSNITLTPNPCTTTCTIAATGGGGGGGVTSISIASVNGLAGSSSGGNTPILTLSTSITGVLKGNGTAVSAAAAGTDYLAPSGNGSALTGLTWSQIGSTPTTLAGYGITNGQSTSLATGDVWQGNGSNIAAAVTLSAALDAAIGSTQGDILYRGASGWAVLAPGTNGYFLQTQGPAANPTYAPASGGTGCNTGGAATDLLTADGAGGCTTVTVAKLVNGALALGASGTAGSVTMGNATPSGGTVTVQPVTGTLGTVTASLPANSGIVAELNYAQTWSAAQSFNNGDLLLNGSSSGAATLEAPAVASSYVWTGPAASGHLAGYDIAQTWTAAQTFTNSDLILLGSSTGYTTFLSDNAGPTNYILHVPAVNDTIVALAATQILTNKTLTSSTNVLGGVTMTLGSDATGDIYYRNSSGILTRLGIGSTGYVLTVASGLPSWAAAAGGSGYGGEQHFTTNHTVANGDASTNIDMDCASACQVVMPTGITNNIQFNVIATNVGVVQIVGSGLPVTVNSAVGTTIYLSGKGSSALVYNNYNAGGQNAWFVAGNIAP